MAARITLDLPLPPVVNHMYGRNRDGVFTRSHVKRWKKQAGTEILIQITTASVKSLGCGRYGVRIRWPEDDPADVDGRLKAMLDLLVWMRLTPDDRFCRHLSVGFTPTLAAPRCAVRLWSMA